MVCAKQEFLAIATTDGASGDQKIFLAAPLTLKDIETHFANQIEQVENVGWDTRSQSVVAARVRKLGALILEERPLTAADPEAMADAMIKGIAEMGIKALPWTDGCKQFSRTGPISETPLSRRVVA